MNLKPWRCTADNPAPAHKKFSEHPDALPTGGVEVDEHNLSWAAFRCPHCDRRILRQMIGEGVDWSAVTPTA